MKDSDQLRIISAKILRQELVAVAKEGFPYLKERIGDIRQVMEILENSLEDSDQHSTYISNIYRAIEQAEHEVDVLQQEMLKDLNL